jgi:hypothetical protein
MATVSFRQGVNGYTGALDTILMQASPSAAFGTATTLSVDFGTGVEEQTLLAFDNLFGSGAGQIPVDATITSATLTLQTTNSSANGGGLYRMLADWTNASTWSQFGGNGVQADGGEAVASADVVVGSVASGSRGFDVTKSLQAWAAAGTTAEAHNAANQGWLFKTPSTDGWGFYSSEGSTKPLLSVTYTLDGTPPPPAAGVTITHSGGTTTIAEGGATDSFQVALASRPADNVMIAIAGNNDIGLSAATLTFTPDNWQTLQTVTLTAVDDSLVEGTETPSVTLTASSADASYNNLAIAPVPVTITDNDAATPAVPTVSIQGPSNPQTEGPNAKIMFTLKLDQAATQDVTISYSTVDGTAKAGSDFVGLTDGSIVFRAGDTSKTIDVLLQDDTLVESSETFTVQINSATNAKVGTSSAIGTIEDNDGTTPPPPIRASVVKVTDLTSGPFKSADATGYGSGDPSGLAYVPSLQKLFIADSEHDESPFLSSTNLFSIGPNGAVEGYSMIGFTKEPTGLAFNPGNGYLYITDDDKQEVFWVDPTSPSTKKGSFDTASLGLVDTEDPKFDPEPGNIFVLDGSLKKIFELTPQGEFVSSIALPTVMKDAEALAYDPSHKVFFVASGKSTRIWELDRSGSILATTDLLSSSSYLNPIGGAKPTLKGLELAPSSDPNDGTKMNLFVADYGVDQRNDGRLFEVNLGPDWFTV